MTVWVWTVRVALGCGGQCDDVVVPDETGGNAEEGKSDDVSIAPLNTSQRLGRRDSVWIQIERREARCGSTVDASQRDPPSQRAVVSGETVRVDEASSSRGSSMSNNRCKMANDHRRSIPFLVAFPRVRPPQQQPQHSTWVMQSKIVVRQAPTALTMTDRIPATAAKMPVRIDTIAFTMEDRHDATAVGEDDGTETELDVLG
ncbi:hypothetical protein V8E36_002669 [Tilletia maclaganii]